MFLKFLIGATVKREWAGMFHLMALATVMGRPIFSVYPNAVSSIRILLHGVIVPRVINHMRSMPTVFIMWSRDGNLDATRGVWFQPNHFIPLLEVEEGDPIKEKEFKQCGSATQRNITSFFGPKQSKKRKLPQEGSLSSCNYVKSETKLKAPRKSNKSENTKGRRVTSSTVEKWKKNDLAIFEADTWLVYEVDQSEMGKFCSSLKCTVCVEFEQGIKKRRNFSRSWIDGSANFKLSNVIDHAKSDAHNEALALYKRRMGKAPSPPVPTGNQRTLEFKLSKEQEEVFKKKFDISYFVVKEEMPLSKYEKIIQLEKRHGVRLGSTHNNRTAAREFLSFQAGELKEALSKEIAEAKFYSILFDGTTDSSVTEQEAIFVLYFDPDGEPADNISNEPEIAVKTSYLSLQSLSSSTAQGVVDGIKKALIEAGLKDVTTVTPPALGGDGCSTNRGEKGGVKGILKKEYPWFLFVWCIAHRLELALKDALSSTYFKEIDDCLLKPYYLYEKSPKRLRSLQELSNIYKDSLEFVEGSMKPKRASGTRWITHKLNALKVLVDKFGIFIQHLESCSSDKSVKADDRAKLKGYLRKWKSGKLFIYSCFFIDLLETAACLSAAFQETRVDAVTVSLAMAKAKKHLLALKEKEVDKLRTVRYYLTKVNDCCYQGVQLPGLDDAVEQLKKDGGTLIDLLTEAILERCEGTDDTMAMAKVLNCEVWSNAYSSSEEIDHIILKVSDQFQDALKQHGFSSSGPGLLDEWHELVEYTVEFLSPSSRNYRATWYKLFHLSIGSTRWNNVLLLVRLLFCLPVSNAIVERFFGSLKKVKTGRRAALGQKTTEDILTMMTEGPPFEEYDATSAVRSWYSSKSRRLNQKERKSYKKRPLKRPKMSDALSDSESDQLNEEQSNLDYEIEDLDESAIFSQSDSENELQSL